MINKKHFVYIRADDAYASGPYSSEKAALADLLSEQGGDLDGEEYVIYQAITLVTQREQTQPPIQKIKLK